MGDQQDGVRVGGNSPRSLLPNLLPQGEGKVLALGLASSR